MKTLLLSVALASVFVVTTPHPAEAGATMGAAYAFGEGINPLLDGNTSIVYDGTGAAIARDEDGGSEWLISDHLGSLRVTPGQSHGYGPHGTPNVAAGAHYAGHPYDPDLATYQTPSRRYDPRLGRFQSRDIISGGENPYSYANGNPINAVDPDGRTSVYFLLHSHFGVNQPDRSGRPGLRSDLVELHEVAAVSRHAIAMSPIEGTVQDILPLGVRAEHLTLFLHGGFGVVTLWDSVARRPMDLGGGAFASYLHYQMRHQYGTATVETLRSINITSCFGACRTRSSTGSGVMEDSFADVFARSARPFFPRLEQVVASPYAIGMGTTTDSFGLRSTVVDVESHAFRRRAGRDYAVVRYMVDPDDFFAGIFPEPMYTTPSRALQTINDPHDRPIYGVYERQNSIDSRTRDLMQVWDLVHRYRSEFSEPSLMRIPVLPAPVGDE